MKPTRRDLYWLLLVLAMGIVWLIDHQKMDHHADLLRRQMDRYYWQADKLASWIENNGNAKSIDVNYDAITITGNDERSYEYVRRPP